MRELGEATVQLLLNILRGNVKDAVSVTRPHALIVRASTGAPRRRTALHRRARLERFRLRVGQSFSSAWRQL